MACQNNVIVLQAMSFMVNERSERSGMLPRHCGCTQDLIYKKNFYRKSAYLFFHSPRKSPLWSKHGWRIAFALNTDGFTANNEQANLNGDNSSFGGTRLSRIVGAGGRQLLNKLNSARKNFPMKVFLLLFGFYTANALATILGQTGDWDVLVAGLVVAVIEGIGMLMYRRPAPSGKLQYLLVLINYWKAGVCLGLFVDAFKLGS